MNPTPQSFQAGLPSLPIAEGSFGDTAPRFHPRTQHDDHALSDTIEPYSNTAPSPSQQEAIHVLQHFDNKAVAASLANIRSYEADLFQHNPLVKRHIGAFLQLKDCTDSLVLAWLNSYRSTGTFNTSSTSPTANDVNTQWYPFWREATPLPESSLVSTARSSTISAWPPSTFNNGSGIGTPGTSIGRAGSYQETSSDRSFDDRASSSAAIKHPHGCPLCLKSRSFETCDGWKRHMKEHDTVYPCILCLDHDHVKKAKSYSRKTNLLGHLEASHEFSHEEGSDLAETWKKTIPKQYFSCGFCISLFTSILDQLNHIDNEHFKKMQQIGEWDINKVIRGLLKQPDVAFVWQNVFQSNSASQELTWVTSVAKDLQLRLELSNETARDLAESAITLANWRGSPQNSSGISAESAFSQQQNISSFPGYTDLSMQPTLTPRSAPFSSIGESDGLDPQAQQDPLAWDTFNQASLVTFQSPPEILGSQITSCESIFTGDRHPGNNGIVDRQQAGKDDWLPQQATNPAPWTGTVVTDCNHDEGGKLQSAMPALPLVVPQSMPKLSSSLSPYQQSPLARDAQRAAHTAGILPRISSSVLPVGHLHNRSSIRDLVPSAARLNKLRSQKKLGEHYGAPDLDFEQLQHLMRDDDRSRSSKRPSMIP